MIAANYLTDFYAYVQGVRDGEIVACRAVKAAVERFLRDREREGSADFPYYFDEEKAQAAIDWFPANCRHTIGRFASDRFELASWQQFGVGNIQGWRRVSDGTRRFRRVFWSMARKNGKSTLAAGLAIHAAKDDIDPLTEKREATAQVILAAAKREQADIVTYAEVSRMVNKAGSLIGKFTEKYKQITFNANEGMITTVGSNKPYDGLNPSMILLDEIHAWTENHRPFYDTMLTGSASRTQPLTICTTTAGAENSYIWKAEHEYASGVVHGHIDDDRWFALIYELDTKDDPLNEANWVKANPNLGVSVSEEYLRDQAKLAKNSAQDLKRFERYHGNRVVAATVSAFDMEAWDACEGELADWADADAVGGGVDLGGQDDLASYGLVARFLIAETVPKTEEDEPQPVWRYEIRSRSYISADSERDLTQEPFYQWIYEDKLCKSDTPILDLKESLVNECHRWNVNDVAFDPAGAQVVGEHLKESGVEAGAMAQNYTMFNEPIRDFQRALREGRVVHDGDPVLRWCATNAMAIENEREHMMFNKAKSKDKIDPIVAVTMAYRRAMVAPPRAQGSLFLSR